MITVPQPTNVFNIFLELTKIPRGSGNTKAVSDYCVNFAKKNGLWCRQDSANNVIIKKDASSGYENYAPVIIQGHLDMVCEKTSDCDINFETDALEIETDGEYIYAKNTTLGGDNGIAVAYALAILEANDIQHPPLEVVLTSDEETGMDGAIALDCSDLNAKMLLNIDSEQEGIFTVSCAGGINVTGELPLLFKKETASGVNIKICGLKGGHSGVEIDKKRANANIIAGRLLSKLCEKSQARLSSINGGLKGNAIPAECNMVLALDYNEDNKKIISEFLEQVKEEYKISDSKIDILVECFETKELMLSSYDETKNIASLLCNMPDGIKSMSQDIEGLVKTSSNLGILRTDDKGLTFLSSVRSSDESEKEEYSNEILNHIIAHKGIAKKSDEYPAWEYLANSPLRDVMCEVYEKMYHKKPVTEAIHAGLECGIFCGKIKGLDCVSFGPDMFDIHTPKERLNIKSVERTWEFLKNILKELKI